MNIEYFKKTLKSIMDIPSPSGYTKEAMHYIQNELTQMGYTPSMNHKGNLYVKVSGSNHDHPIAFSAHCDTLGLMVRSIKDNGTLAITTIGGPCLPTLDGEYCTVITRDNKRYSGTILSTSPSVHVFKDASTVARDIDHMIVRIDEVVNSKDDVLKLGINNGDIIAYDPKTTFCESGYIKSRFLDDKLCVAIQLAVLKALSDNKMVPSQDTWFCFSSYEEVGHGASWLPQEIETFISVDMGCVGEDLSCKETQVSICAKDSGGPYDYDLVSTMIELSQTNHIDYVVDIYPMYGSDTGAALRGGNNIKGGLIGPGVAASHGMERSHMDGVSATYGLIMALMGL